MVYQFAMVYTRIRTSSTDSSSQRHIEVKETPFGNYKTPHTLCLRQSEAPTFPFEWPPFHLSDRNDTNIHPPLH